MRLHDYDECDCHMWETWPHPETLSDYKISGHRRHATLRHIQKSWYALSLPLNWISW